ncbi:MAG: hypothetical protein IPK99_05105 [Flavobacteriales bacterium]|nr:hypothetical protein [Flavobacteriales bacterium]
MMWIASRQRNARAWNVSDLCRTMCPATSPRSRLLLALLPAVMATSAIGQQLLDDFNRAANTVVGGGWTEVEAGAVVTGAQIGATGELTLGSTIAGRDYVWRDARRALHHHAEHEHLRHHLGLLRATKQAGSLGIQCQQLWAAFVLGGTTSDFTQGYGMLPLLANAGNRGSASFGALQRRGRPECECGRCRERCTGPHRSTT